jgi:hypothetical protein
MWNNPMIMDPAGTDPSIMAPTMYLPGVLKVYHPDGWHHSFRLEARVNHVVIRGGSELYTFVVETDGHEPKKLKVSAGKLLETTRENPLIINFGPGMHMLRLQPGPDLGIDAMISDLDPEKNFGDHPYFEATFRSEPILTVMRENRSLIRFSPTGLPKSALIQKVVLRLFYDLPVPWDSVYMDTISAKGIYPVYGGGVLQQIVEPWEEHEVTWATQPKTITANQVYIHPFIKNANFIDVDVTKLFVPEQEIAAPNYGMMFKISPEQSFPGFRFTSSDYNVPEMRPVLTIHYSLPIR